MAWQSHGLGIRGLGWQTGVPSRLSETAHPYSMICCNIMASSMQPHLDRTQIQIQKTRDFGCREGVDLVQQNHSAIVVGQVVQAALHAEAGLPPLRDLSRRRTGADCRLYLLGGSWFVDGVLGLPLAQVIKAHVSGNAVQPATD